MEFGKKKEKRLTVGQWVSIGLGVLLGGLVLMLIGVWIWFAVTFVPYKKSEPALRIFHPKGWSVPQRVADGVLVAFASPRKNDMDGFTDNVNFTRYDMGSEELSNEAYADLLAEQMAAVFQEFIITEKSWFPVGGRSGRRTVLTSTDPSRVMVLYTFVIHEMGYNLVYMGEPEPYLKDGKLLDAMAFTLRVKY